jgi:hypothetical protein
MKRTMVAEDKLMFMEVYLVAFKEELLAEGVAVATVATAGERAFERTLATFRDEKDKGPAS